MSHFSTISKVVKSIIFASAILAQMFVNQLAFSIKVGYYDNYPLCYDESGKPNGLFIDVLKQVFAKDFGSLTFVFGEFSSLMEKLKSGEIDLLCVVADTPERNQNYSFNTEPVIVNWGVLVSNNRSITSITQIEQLVRKRIAVNKGDVYYKYFKKLLEDFKVKSTFVELETYYDVLAKVNEGEYEFGVVSRLAYLVNTDKFPYVQQTSFVFSPVQIKYAVKRGKNSELLKMIDKKLVLLKNEGTIDNLINKYLQKNQKERQALSIDAKLILVFGVLGAIVFLIIVIFILRIKKLTIEIKQQKEVYESVVKNLDFKSTATLQNEIGIFEEAVGFKVFQKYLELSSREEHPLSILAIEVENLKENQISIFEECLIKNIRPGDFAFKSGDRIYIAILYLHAAFFIEKFKHTLENCLKDKGIEAAVYLGTKIIEPQLKCKPEEAIIDALAHLKAQQKFKKK